MCLGFVGRIGLGPLRSASSPNAQAISEASAPLSGRDSERPPLRTSQASAPRADPSDIAKLVLSAAIPRVFHLSHT